MPSRTKTCAEFGVRFDVVTSESELYGTGLIERALADLAARDLTFDGRRGALAPRLRGAR